MLPRISAKNPVIRSPFNSWAAAAGLYALWTKRLVDAAEKVDVEDGRLPRSPGCPSPWAAMYLLLFVLPAHWIDSPEPLPALLLLPTPSGSCHLSCPSSTADGHVFGGSVLQPRDPSQYGTSVASGQFLCLSLSADQQMAAAGTGDGKIHIFQLRSLMEEGAADPCLTLDAEDAVRQALPLPAAARRFPPPQALRRPLRCSGSLEPWR